MMNNQATVTTISKQPYKPSLSFYLKKSFRVFIDTCSILRPEFEIFMDSARSQILETNCPLIVPKRCYDEVKKHSNSTEPRLKAIATKRLNQLNEWHHEGLIKVFGEDSESKLADSVFLTEFMAYRQKYSLVLISQDRNLCHEINNLNFSKAVSLDKGAKRIYIFRINNHGELSNHNFITTRHTTEIELIQKKQTKKAPEDYIPSDDFTFDPTTMMMTDSQDSNEPIVDGLVLLDDEDEDKKPTVEYVEKEAIENNNTDIKPKKNQANRNNNKTNQNKNKNTQDKGAKNPPKPTIKPFKSCSEVTTLEDCVIDVSHTPASGETLYTDLEKTAPVKLQNQVASGGEGVIFETDDENDLVAKIYKPQNNTTLKQKKIEKLISKHLKYKGICLPSSALYNDEGKFVGYLMPKASGKELQRGVFVKPLLLRNFPNWKKIDLVTLCLTILTRIQFLHKYNIILGDINPANILVVSPKEVYFVDTDSYQVEDLPCPVGTINYTAPEIQGKAYKDFLRTLGNEQFAVATLLFMIMLPGKTPYAQQGGESAEANIKSMDFPYPFGDLSNGKAPEGPWKFIWSHLPYELKEAFYKTFAANGDYAKEDNRLTEERWIGIFNNYYKLLSNGTLGKQDPMSEELFPTRHKNSAKENDSNVEYIECKLCHQKVQKKDSRYGICNDCLKPTKGEVYQCECCNKPLIYTNFERFIKKTKKYPFCDECRNTVVETRYCKSCYAPFKLTKADVYYYQQRGLDLPKRCEKCRKANNSAPIFGSAYRGNRRRGSNASSNFANKLGIIIVFIFILILFLTLKR